MVRVLVPGTVLADGRVPSAHVLSTTGCERAAGEQDAWGRVPGMQQQQPLADEQSQRAGVVVVPVRRAHRASGGMPPVDVALAQEVVAIQRGRRPADLREPRDEGDRQAASGRLQSTHDVGSSRQ